MLKLVLAATLALFLAVPAEAQTAADVNAQMQTQFGASKPFEQAFAAIQKAVAAGDAATLSQWVAYPFRVSYDDEELVIDNPDEFVANYSDIVTDDIVAAVTDQAYENLFVNAEGVMFGNGEMWLTMVCRDDACTQSDVKITAIQSTLQ